MNKQEIQDMKITGVNLRKLIAKRYSPSFISRVHDSFSGLAGFIIICLYLIFRPLNIIAIGVTIIALSLLL